MRLTKGQHLSHDYDEQSQYLTDFVVALMQMFRPAPVPRREAQASGETGPASTCRAWQLAPITTPPSLTG